MKYLPTVRLDNQGITDLHEGKLKLQCGQWVCINQGDKPSRFVRAGRHSIQAVHPHGEKGVTPARFKEAVAGWPRLNS